jgi:hypothetical protein
VIPEMLKTHAGRMPPLLRRRATGVVTNTLVTTLKPLVGTVITALAEFALTTPCKVSDSAMVTCSGYVPGQTSIVDPGEAAFTAS